jgi:regulator of protease activity HflC (stomatin/prohibitin superfamily)
MTTNKLVKYGVIAVVLIILFFVFKPFQIVDAGNKGLKFRMGAIQDQVVDQGFNWRMPLIENIREITIRPIQLDDKVEVGANGAITKDNQTIGAEMTVFYTYDQNKLVSVYKDVGEDKLKSIISTSLKESFKAVVGNYTIFELPVSQEAIRSKAFTEIKNKMTTYPVNITELKITNYDWSDEFDKQIAETMSRAQQVKQAEQQLLIVQQQAQKIVKEAEAAKEAARLNAEAKALEGEGIKKYNDSIAVNWAIELKKLELQIEMKKAEKWNGQYISQNSYGPIPFSTGDILGK